MTTSYLLRQPTAATQEDPLTPAFVLPTSPEGGKVAYMDEQSQVEPPKADQPKKVRGRSPSYPAISLPVAIERAKVLYQEEKQHAAPMDTVVRHWGYRSFNGPASLAVAALKKFGLIEDQGAGAGRRAAVTDLAVTILSNPDQQARRVAIQEAALKPAIHRDLWNKYGAELPSDETLKWELTREREQRFTDTGADEFIPEYRHTLAFAGLPGTDSVGTQIPDVQSEDDGDESESEPPDLPQRTKRHPIRRSGGMSEAGILTIPVPVIGGPPITIEGEFPVSEVAWTQFIAVLQAMKPGLVAQRQTEDDVPID